MLRKTVVRTLFAAAIGVSVFATVAYALTWVQLRAGPSSALSGAREK